MPTGYTHKLYEGEQSFEDFVWSCARAFGAFVLMRDEPSDAPFTDERLVDHYYEKRVGETEAELAEWNASGPEARRAMYDSWYATTLESNRKHEEERIGKLTRYQEMVERVTAWQPPSEDHASLRKFMLEQLGSSIEFDCGRYERPLETFGDWCAGRDRELARAVEVAKREHAKEVERNESRLRWVRQLRESVPMPTEQKP